jgi:hypothetical protein
MRKIISRRYALCIIVSALVMIISSNVAAAIIDASMKGQLFLLSIVESVVMMILVAIVNGLNFLFEENTKEFLVSFNIPIVVWAVVVGWGVVRFITDRNGDPTGFFFSGSAIVPLLFNIWTRKTLKKKLA